MNTSNTSLSHAATILPVRNMLTSLDFYRDQLNFNVLFEYNDPIEYVVLKRNEISIHLTSSGAVLPSKSTALYIFAYDVDAVYEDLISRGIAIHNDIGNREHGMRDFDVKDPDGHIICFGTGLNRKES